MKAIEIQTDNEEIINAFKKLAKAFKVDFFEKDVSINDINPSPSNEHFFENPKNLAEIEAGLVDVKEGKILKMDRNERKKLLHS